MAAKHQRTNYEDFEPPAERSEEDGCSILTVYIPGFSKEQIRVQVSSGRKLRISGERPYRNKAGQRFHKEFEIPPNCDTTNITAKYKGGILYVRQPQLLQPSPKPIIMQPPQQQQAADRDQGAFPPKVEDTATKQTTSSNNDNNAEKEAANIKNESTSTTGAVGRLKEAIPRVLVKLILPIFLPLFLFLCAKTLTTSTMFLGVVREPPH